MDKTIDISVDIETFSTAPTASIATIGAVAWGDGVDAEKSEFYIVVDDPNGTFDPRTIRWHGDIGDGQATMGLEKEAVHLHSALVQFRDWMNQFDVGRAGCARIWSHATFDIPILAAAYRRAGFSNPPWQYRSPRDLRTLYDLAGGRPALEFEGTLHNALSDAKYQMLEVIECRRILKEKGS